jgi:hypothetical protein
MIEKGIEWGEQRSVPEGTHLAATDGGLRQWIVAHRQRAERVPDVAISGGDLGRTVSAGALVGRPATYAAFDLVRVTADGEHVTWAAAHVVARRSWWWGEVLLAMNAEHLGRFDVAPRAHPNDGLVDVVRVDPAMRPRARRQARRRACTGTHLPHPLLTVARGAHHTVGFARPLWVWVDGGRWHRATSLQLDVEIDAYRAYF